MVFSSLTFLYLFLPSVFLLYYLVPGKARNVILLIFSLFFYFYGEQLYLLVMLGEIAAVYAAGLLIGRQKENGAGRKVVLVLFLVFSLGMLAVFKYAGLFARTVDALTAGALSAQSGLSLFEIHMPIGISFYTFQGISYVLDVYRKREEAEKNPLRLAAYISLFPQLIAGPIVRYGDVAKELKEKRTFSLSKFSEGAVRFVIGLGKKVLLADRLYAFCQSASAATESSIVLAWAEGLCFLLYVYFDFSGYSDMAIGLCTCLGFSIPENFRYPLTSRGFREFWRRWHISLGSWFRDYLYIPMGGSRKGIPVQIRNLIVVWALTGLWHGASWNYVVWGLGFGLLIIIETLIDKKRGRKPDTEAPFRFRSIPNVLLVAVLTVVLFVWFRFQDWGDAVSQAGKMFGSVPFWSGETAYLLRGMILLLPVSLIGATPVPKTLVAKLEGTKAGSFLVPAGRVVWTVGLLALATAYLVDGSFSPFLYFRF